MDVILQIMIKLHVNKQMIDVIGNLKIKINKVNVKIIHVLHMKDKMENVHIIYLGIGNLITFADLFLFNVWILM